MSRSILVLAAVAASLLAGCVPEEGPLMQPGSDCMECHGRGGGDEEAPPWTVAGTVFSSQDAAAGGVRGVAIQLTDATGRVVTLHSNQAGNFYLADGLRFPLRVALERGGITHPMAAAVQDGSCNRCHSTSGEGRLAAP
jgi:hypothetical protein